MISAEKVEGTEHWAAHYGSMGVFISRLLPVVRHLIGIPAGIVRMNYQTFSIYTLLGSAIWCALLCYVGIKMGEDQALMKGELHRISLWLGGGMLVLGAMYYFLVHRQMKARISVASLGLLLVVACASRQSHSGRRCALCANQGGSGTRLHHRKRPDRHGLRQGERRAGCEVPGHAHRRADDLVAGDR